MVTIVERENGNNWNWVMITSCTNPRPSSSTCLSILLPFILLLLPSSLPPSLSSFLPPSLHPHLSTSLPPTLGGYRSSDLHLQLSSIYFCLPWRQGGLAVTGEDTTARPWHHICSAWQAFWGLWAQFCSLSGQDSQQLATSGYVKKTVHGYLFLNLWREMINRLVPRLFLVQNNGEEPGYEATIVLQARPNCMHDNMIGWVWLVRLNDRDWKKCVVWMYVEVPV